jgi:hypothetical protein
MKNVRRPSRAGEAKGNGREFGRKMRLEGIISKRVGTTPHRAWQGNARTRLAAIASP